MSIKYCEWSEEELTYPEFYKTGDRGWIGRQLARLTFNQRKIACSEYREVYLRLGRNSANQWLLDLCNETGKSREEMKEQSVTANPLQSKIDAIRGNAKRKSILDMADERREQHRINKG